MMKVFVDYLNDEKFLRYVEKRMINHCPTYSFQCENELFHYSPFKDYAIKNVINGTISYSRIDRFNDIFDSKINYLLSPEECKKEVQKDIDNLKNMVHNIGLDTILPVDTNTNFGGLYNYYKNKSRADFRLADNLGTYVCCFSSNSNSPLMWAHYGNNSKGIMTSIKLSNNKILSNITFPVLYSEKPPLLKDLLDDPDNKTCQSPIDAALLISILSKSIEWAYEKEYRSVFSGLGSYKEKNPYIQSNKDIVYDSLTFGFHFLKNFIKEDEKDEKYVDNIKLLDELITSIKSKNMKVYYNVPINDTYKTDRVELDINAFSNFVKEYIHDCRNLNTNYYSLLDSFLDNVVYYNNN